MEYSSFTLSPRPLASTAANNVYNATFAKLGMAIRSSFHQKHGSDVIISIEQTNKQTTRRINTQINKQKLNYGIYRQNSLNLRSNVLARFFHRSLSMSKEKQC